MNTAIIVKRQKVDGQDGVKAFGVDESGTSREYAETDIGEEHVAIAFLKRYQPRVYEEVRRDNYTLVMMNNPLDPTQTIFTVCAGGNFGEMVDVY